MENTVDDQPLRLLTINTHKGFSSLNKRFTLHRLRDAIRSTGADIVFLQEVIGENVEKAKKHDDWPEFPHYRFLAESIWSNYAYGKNSHYPEGHHGNALLSKYPIVHSEKIDISTNRFEQRGFLHCVLDIPRYPHHVHCICVHLGLTARSRKKQTNMIKTYTAEKIGNGAPLIIAGDFNDWRGKINGDFSKSLHLNEVVVETRGKAARTFPAWMPLIRLDRIYLREFTPVSSEIHHKGIWSRLSDHAALFTEVIPSHMSIPER
ncbi:endonuclease/exonuclease/phosphatase family protein [bacterium]|nr:endonuclease/exonuclease/phosphatase family protein [bacterium]